MFASQFTNGSVRSSRTQTQSPLYWTWPTVQVITDTNCHDNTLSLWLRFHPLKVLSVRTLEAYLCAILREDSRLQTFRPRASTTSTSFIASCARFAPRNCRKFMPSCDTYGISTAHRNNSNNIKIYACRDAGRGLSRACYVAVP